MNRLHRYLFKQILVAVVLALGLFVFVLVVGNVIGEVLDQLASGRLSGKMFCYLVGLLIPTVIPYALPLGLLTGILLVMGRLSSQLEIVAMKAVGWSVYRIAASALFIALLGTLLSVGINFYYAPAADVAYRKKLASAIKINPLQFIQPNTFTCDFPGYLLYVGQRKGASVEDFWIWELDEKNHVRVFIRAKEGHFSYDLEKEALVLTLKNGMGEKRSDKDLEKEGSYSSVAFAEWSVRLPLGNIFGSRSSQKKLSLMTLPELWRARHLEGETPSKTYKNRIAVQLQIQKNFAMAFSILSMALVAVPLGIKASRSETFVNLGIALVLAFAYYLFTVVISWLEKCPNLRPDWLIWLPNLFFQGLGGWFLIRANKH